MPEEIDYEAEAAEGKDDLPESSGTWIDRFFWWGWRWFLPSWMHGDAPVAKWVIDQVWIECAWCLFMRGVFLGGCAGVATGIVIGLLF